MGESGDAVRAIETGRATLVSDLSVSLRKNASEARIRFISGRPRKRMVDDR